jgi:opacity protein-like surface antigen
MTHQLNTRLHGSTIIGLALICALWSTSAAATELPSVTDLLKAVASLEARVAALEGQLQSANARTRQAETATPRPILASLNAVAPTYAPMQLGQSGKSLVEPPPEYVWSGLYWGTSFGYGSTSSKTRYRIRDRSTSTSTSSSSEFGEDSFSDTSRGVSQQTTTGESEGENDGALADLYLGVSTRLTPRILAGVQVEGALTQMNFNSPNGPQQIVSSSTSRGRSSFTSRDGFMDESTGSSQSDESRTSLPGFNNDIQLDWMVSVIGRAGWLATPSTLLYGLAGWSYGRFELDETAFALNGSGEYGAHGLTIGGGFEQKLSPKWSLRAEYRYTDFGRENFSFRRESA